MALAQSTALFPGHVFTGTIVLSYFSAPSSELPSPPGALCTASAACLRHGLHLAVAHSCCGAAPFARTHLCPLPGACRHSPVPSAPTLTCACLVHRSYGNIPHLTLLLQALRLPVCIARFRSCSPALGEGLTPGLGFPPSLLLLVPWGTLLWAQGLPFCPFRILFVPVLSREVPQRSSVICTMNGESLCLPSETSRNPESPHPHPASAFSLALAWEVR